MRSFFVTLLFFFFLFAAQPAQAHPHEWIDVRSTLIFDAQGQVTAIRERWLFDIYYTALSLPDFDENKNGALDHNELLALANGNLSNLKDYSYFTYMETDGKAVEFADVSDVESRIIDGRIEMQFTLKLKEPINPSVSQTSYRIYDPSYYVAMLHEKQTPVILENSKACNYSLSKPQPDIVWVTLAQALDKKATALDDLGQHFAERVTVICP